MDANFQHPARLRLSHSERRLWLAAIGLWFVGDLAITTFGLWWGLTEGNLFIVLAAVVLGVDLLAVLVVSKIVVLMVSGLSFAVLPRSVRVFIPLTYVGVGAWTLTWNLWALWTSVG